MVSFYDFYQNKNSLLVSSGSSAIYLILKSNGITNKNIIVPANICYIVVYAIINSGNIPLFIDISDNEDGNVSYDTFAKAVTENKVAAAIIPHMYGNNCIEIKQIQQLSKNKNILLIEDCASSLGGTITKKQVGSFGDYAIYSFGYSKTIEIGFGGLIISDRELQDIKTLNETFPVKNVECDEITSQWSKIYRILRNTKDTKLSKLIYKNMAFIFGECMQFKLSNAQKEKIRKELKNSKMYIEMRKENYEYYKKNINSSVNLKIMRNITGSVPWRFSLLLKQMNKKLFIKELLNLNIPVSDWYPVVTHMFDDMGNYPNAKKMEQEIINFPLINISKNNIEKISIVINKLSKNKEYLK